MGLVLFYAKKFFKIIRNEVLVLPSRVIGLPIAFDDELTREAINRYRITTRMDVARSAWW